MLETEIENLLHLRAAFWPGARALTVAQRETWWRALHWGLWFDVERAMRDWASQKSTIPYPADIRKVLKWHLAKRTSATATDRVEGEKLKEIEFTRGIAAHWVQITGFIAECPDEEIVAAFAELQAKFWQLSWLPAPPWSDWFIGRCAKACVWLWLTGRAMPFEVIPEPPSRPGTLDAKGLAKAAAARNRPRVDLRRL